MEMTDVIVVGGGLIGSAAARHLAEAGAAVTLIGAPRGNADGVHASHYDQARVTRFIDHDPIWSDLAAASIARYADIEQRSGVAFHTACGHLRSDLPPKHADSVLESVREVARNLPGQVEELSEDEVRHRFPYLRFQNGAVLHWDSPPSGYINPLRLVSAQKALARTAGADTVEAVVVEIRPASGSFKVRDSQGGTHRANKVLVAAGAYTERFPLLPHAIGLEVRPETVVLMEASAELQATLVGMPSIIWNFPEEAGRRYVYVLPPVLYPDGCHYVKLGSDHDPDIAIDTPEETRAYMKSEGSTLTRHLLTPVLTRLVPALAGTRVKTKPCLLTYTRSGYPAIDELKPGWFVAAGGCGRSAKSSDQLGKLAADMVMGKPWEGFQRSRFGLSEDA